MDPERVERIEQDLEKLRAVRAARIRADGDQIQEVHVIALPGRDAKGIVRDIVTTLYAWHGLRLNFRKVSVAVIGNSDMKSEEDNKGSEDSGRRLEYVSVNSMLHGARVETQVELAWAGGTLMGSSTGLNTPEARLRLVGEATLEAVQQAMQEDSRWSLGDVVRLRLGESEAIAVKVLLLIGRRRQALAGCALVGNHVEEAVVFAVLQAVNRAVPRYMKPVWTEYSIDGDIDGEEEPVATGGDQAGEG
ncbi:MAG: hypothetical protein GF355_09020 [Candidatus Eisenbacteria bacterium]|nr:hypothetical protein [Candidatus Eisenbacteria bacterium]